MLSPPLSPTPLVLFLSAVHSLFLEGDLPLPTLANLLMKECVIVEVVEAVKLFIIQTVKGFRRPPLEKRRQNRGGGCVRVDLRVQAVALKVLHYLMNLSGP